MFRLQESFDLLFFELLVTLTQLPLVALSLCANIGLVVRDHTQEELLTRSPPLYWVKPSFLNLFMKKLTLGCADHLRQHLLRYFGKYLLRLVRRATTREQQPGACQPFLAGVKSWSTRSSSTDVPCEHIGDESVGELVFGNGGRATTRFSRSQERWFGVTAVVVPIRRGGPAMHP